MTEAKRKIRKEGRGLEGKFDKGGISRKKLV